MAHIPIYWKLIVGCGTLLSKTQISHLLDLLCCFAVMEIFFFIEDKVCNKSMSVFHPKVMKSVNS